MKAPPVSIPINTNTVLAISSSSPKSEKSCNYCRRPGHVISECRKLQYKNNKTQTNVPIGKPYHRQSHVVGAVTEELSPTFSLSDLESILKQLAASTSTSASAQASAQSAISSALSVTPGISNSWFFDSGCCNHMTAQSNFFVSKTTPSRTPAIHTTDNSKLLVSHTGAISTPSLSLADVLLVPRLTLNLISVGQLCELGFTVTFSDHGCIVQDP